jgi:hypothetical protein
VVKKHLASPAKIKKTFSMIAQDFHLVGKQGIWPLLANLSFIFYNPPPQNSMLF